MKEDKICTSLFSRILFEYHVKDSLHISGKDMVGLLSLSRSGCSHSEQKPCQNKGKTDGTCHYDHGCSVQMTPRI